MSNNYDVLAYYFPNYHFDRRNREVHGEGWNEWELVRHARSRFPGHELPRVPLWGYEDESDLAAMARKIDAAADHGLTGFIFDWYWYNDGPFLELGLDKGFLAAGNNSRLKFALMWANHDWFNIHPAKRKTPHHLLYPGAVTRATFERLTDHVIARYFCHPSYWKIDGRPYFSIYDLPTLIGGLGGPAATRAALDNFRHKSRAAGFPDLHLNAVVWGEKILPNEEAIQNPDEALAILGFDSVASYVWVHHVKLKDFPATDYQYVAAEAEKHWRKSREKLMLPFYPNVTMGWDSSPRTVQSDVFEPIGYPFTPTISNNTPANFKGALQQAKAFLDEKPNGPNILSLNAWNEWTEGSYLEPDTYNGLAYLEAIRDVFKS